MGEFQRLEEDARAELHLLGARARQASQRLISTSSTADPSPATRVILILYEAGAVYQKVLQPKQCFRGGYSGTTTV